MIYKYSVGDILMVDPVLIAFHKQFKPPEIITKTHGIGLADFESVIIVAIGTIPGNSGSQMKAYAVMRPNGEIGAATEGALKQNVD